MRRSPIHPNEGDTSEVGGRAGKRGVREIAEVGRPVTKRLKGSDTLSFDSTKVVGSARLTHHKQ
ncbi:unnamed protein product [Prunus armeniaca]